MANNFVNSKHRNNPTNPERVVTIEKDGASRVTHFMWETGMSPGRIATTTVNCVLSQKLR